jgi:hypothetical protein
MKLSKNFSWHTFQTAVADRQSSFVTDGYKYDIIYVAGGAMMANKRPSTADDITKQNIQNVADWTPLHYNKSTGQYTPITKAKQ